MVVVRPTLLALAKMVERVQEGLGGPILSCLSILPRLPKWWRLCGRLAWRTQLAKMATLINLMNNEPDSYTCLYCFIAEWLGDCYLPYYFDLISFSFGALPLRIKKLKQSPTKVIH